MIQFSHRNERVTKLFGIIFWILAGFHIIFGCIGQPIYYAIKWLDIYEIVDTADILSYVLIPYSWLVS